MRVLALVLAGCCVAGPWLAVTEGQGGQPTFRSGVELVTIDVVVTDREGKPVHNLKPSDFELFENGKSQPIKTFQFVDASLAPTNAILPPGVVTNDVEPGGIFALVLDDIGYYATEARDVRMIAERFLKNAMQPHDHLAVVRSGANSGFTLTTDRALALEAIQGSMGRRDRGVRLEQAGSPDTVGAGDFDSASPGSLGKGSFEVLEAVVEKLRPIPARRKAIVWISRGGEMPANWETNLEIGQPIGRNEDALRELIDKARAANVAIYTVDPRSLVATATDRRAGPAGAESAGSGYDFEDNGTHRDLAAATGGRAIVNTNDINGGLEKMAVENRAYYLLGYEPSPESSKKPKARRIRVVTKAPGVALLHRSLYLPGVAAAETPELIASPLPVRDLPIALAPAVVAIDKKKRGIVLPFQIGRDLRDDTDVEYSAIALDGEGRTVARAAGRGRAKDGRVVGDIGLPVESKMYQVRFAAKALNPELSGVAFADVRVPQPKAKEAQCAGFVFEQPGPRAGLRSFTRDQPLTISTLVSADKLDGAISIGLGAAGGVPQRLWPVKLDQPIENGLWRVALSLKSPLPTGDLEVRVMRDDLLLADSCLAQFSSR